MEEEEEMEVREKVMVKEVVNIWAEGLVEKLMEEIKENIEEEIKEVTEEEEEDDNTEDEEGEENVEMRRWWRSVRASGIPIRITTVRQLRYFDLFDNTEEGDEAEEEEEEEEWEELKVLEEDEEWKDLEVEDVEEVEDQKVEDNVERKDLEVDEEKDVEGKDLEVEEEDVEDKVEHLEHQEENIGEEDVEEIYVDENIRESPRRPSGLGVIEAWASEESLQPRRRWWKPKCLSRGSSRKRESWIEEVSWKIRKKGGDNIRDVTSEAVERTEDHLGSSVSFCAAVLLQQWSKLGILKPAFIRGRAANPSGADARPSSTHVANLWSSAPWLPHLAQYVAVGPAHLWPVPGHLPILSEAQYAAVGPAHPRLVPRPGSSDHGPPHPSPDLRLPCSSVATSTAVSTANPPLPAHQIISLMGLNNLGF